jgi:hypothetical protein
MSGTLSSAAALGFLGSLHCIFMCGPLLAAGAGAHARSPARARLAWFGGRLASYTLAGALFGALGEKAARYVAASAFSRVLLLAVAALALARGVSLLLTRPRSDLVRLGPPSLGERTLRFAAQLVPRRALPLGLLTGVLPCGLLAAAWALAASTSHPLRGALTLALFSLAGVPALAASQLFASRLASLGRRFSPAWQGTLWCALALLLALRPLLEHRGCH